MRISCCDLLSAVSVWTVSGPGAMVATAEARPLARPAESRAVAPAINEACAEEESLRHGIRLS